MFRSKRGTVPAYFWNCRQTRASLNIMVLTSKAIIPISFLRCRLKKRASQPSRLWRTVVKERVKNVLHYKKSAFWVSVVAVVVVTVVSLSLMVSKQLKSASENLPNQGTELKTITESPSVTPELKADAEDEIKISI